MFSWNHQRRGGFLKVILDESEENNQEPMKKDKVTHAGINALKPKQETLRKCDFRKSPSLKFVKILPFERFYPKHKKANFDSESVLTTIKLIYRDFSTRKLLDHSVFSIRP